MRRPRRQKRPLINEWLRLLFGLSCRRSSTSSLFGHMRRVQKREGASPKNKTKTSSSTGRIMGKKYKSNVVSGGGGGDRSPREGIEQGLGALNKTVNEYAQVATMHGVHYVFESKYGRLSSMFWIAVCIALVTMAAILISKTYTSWQDHQITTTVKTTGLPIEDIEFPAITICGLGSMLSNVEDIMFMQVLTFIRQKKNLPDLMPPPPEEGDPCPMQWWQVLESQGLKPQDFLDEYYPHLQNNMGDLFPVLVARNPEPVLLSQYAFEEAGAQSNCPVYVPAFCNDNSTKDVALSDNEKFCGSDDIFYGDGVCFMADSESSTKVQAEETCTDQGGSVIFICEDEKLRSLKDRFLDPNSDCNSSPNIGPNLLTKPSEPPTRVNPLSVLRDRPFWVEDLNSAFAFGSDLYEKEETDSVASVSTQEEETPEFLCAVLTYNSTKGKFVGSHRSCEEQARPLYIIAVYDPCSSKKDGVNEDSGSEKDEPFLDKLINNTADASTFRNFHILSKKKKIKDYFNQIDFARAHTKLFELLWASTLPCFGIENSGDIAMVKKCMWKGTRLPCARIFNTVPTDHGMCCTFNMEAAEHMFKESQYRTTITSMQGRDQTFAESKTPLPKWYISQREPVPQAGMSKGLSIVLDAHTDLISPGSISEDFQGFYAVVDSKRAYPQTDLKNIRLRPGYDNLVSVGASSVTAESRIRSTNPDIRNCLFEDEMELKVHSLYSQAACVLECKIDYVKQNISNKNGRPCVPWYLPSDDDSGAIMYDPWLAYRFQKLMLQVPKEYCSHCLPDCGVTTYTASVSSVPFRRCDDKNLGVSRLCDVTGSDVVSPPIYGTNLHNEYEVSEKYGGYLPDYVKSIDTSTRRYSKNSDLEVFSTYAGEEYDAYEKDIAVVHFYFESSTVFQYGRDLRMTTIDFVSQVGGLLGLCIGFSLASAVEIVYWLTARFWAETSKGIRERRRTGSKMVEVGPI